MTAATMREVLDFAWDGPPPGGAAARRLRLLMLDSLGCMAAGLGHARVRALGAALAGWMPGRLGLPGLEAGLSPAGAAALLAAAMCWDEANEGLARAHGRPGLAVAPVCLAALAGGCARLGEARAAFALGYEVAGRAGEAWRIRPGMHVDGSWHALGAAVAAARLSGADAEGAARAFRLVACQIPFALYAPIAAGLDGRNSYPAHAVLLGTLAAASAAAGMDGPEAALAEARFLALGLDQPPPAAPAGEWLLAEAYIKPFAGVRHAHYAAAAALRLGVAPEAIAALRLETYAEALRYAANRDPASAITAQFSLSWAVAAALAQGDLGPAAYTAGALSDPGLRRIEALVELAEDTALTAAGRRGARLVATLSDGSRRSAEAGALPGDPGTPLHEAEVIAKFRRYAAPVLGAEAAEAAIAALLEGANDAPLPGGILAG